MTLSGYLVRQFSPVITVVGVIQAVWQLFVTSSSAMEFREFSAYAIYISQKPRHEKPAVVSGRTILEVKMKRM